MRAVRRVGASLERVIAACEISLVLPAVLLIGSCAGEEPAAHRGPVVLVTVEGLRADVVGVLGGDSGVTPNLDALAAESTWAGAAVSPSSWSVPAIGSLMTGLSPWQHGALYGERAVLRPELVTMAEALAKVGYATEAYRANYWTRREFGYAQGFGQFTPIRRAERARRELSGLGAGPTFVWLDLPEPSPPYLWQAESERQVRQLAGDSKLPDELPRRVESADLEPYFDPNRPLSAERRRQFWALYLMSVSTADRMLGELLETLRQSGAWNDTLLVVTSTHGTAFGEDGRVGAGGSLDRSLIEVPLIIKLPARSAPLRLAVGERPALHRLFSTVVEAVGGKPVPASLPSLFRHTTDGVLSELYRDNGKNHFSWVRGDRQLVWSVRFAPDEPRFFDARLVLQGLRSPQILKESAAAIFGRLDASFRRRHPLYGSGEQPELDLFEWTAHGRLPLDEPRLRSELALELEAAWCRRAGELTPPAVSCPVLGAWRR